MSVPGQGPVTYFTAGGQPAASAPAPPPTAWWRQPTAVALIIVACIMAPAALAGAYVHTVIMDVDGYVKAVTPIADDPAVQKAVADALSKQVSGALDADLALPDGLPSELGDLGGSMGDQLGDLTGDLTLQVVSSPEFRDFWQEANRRVHPVLVDVIKSKGKVKVSASDLIGLDLAAVTGDVTDLLGTSGVTLPDVFPEGLTSGDVMLLDSRPLASAGAGILALDRLYPLLPIVTLLLLVVAVAIASRRALAALYIGAGLTLAMLALEVGLAVGRSQYLGATDDAGIPHAASAAIWGAITSSLRLWGLVTLGLGVALVVAAALALRFSGHGGRSPGEPRESGQSYADYLYLPGQGPAPGGPGAA